MSYLYGTAGLGDDAKKDALARANLTASAKAGVPGAADQLAQANALIPAQAAYDTAATQMRAAGQGAILAARKLPEPARIPAVAAAKKALEDSIVAALGPRPTATRQTPGAGGAGGVSAVLNKILHHEVAGIPTVALVGGAAILGLIAFSRK